MKNRNKPTEEEALLNAVLGDESWQALNSRLKSQAMRVMCAANYKRRVGLRAGQTACAAALFVSVMWWLGLLPQRAIIQQGPHHVDVAETTQKAEAPLPLATAARFISEEEMLAMFPPGSCVVAEINGQKQLVILDPKIAKEGFTVADAMSPK